MGRHSQHNQHPIRACFNACKIPHAAGLERLIELGLVAEACVTIDDIAPCDAKNACHYLAIQFNYNFWGDPPWINVTERLVNAAFADFPLKFENRPFYDR